MGERIPAGRLRLDEQAPKLYAAVYRLEELIELERGLRLLVQVRASQMNGCAFCIDMHWKDTRAAGESEERLYSRDAWRESPLYSRRERAGWGSASHYYQRVEQADDRRPDRAWPLPAGRPGSVLMRTCRSTLISGASRPKLVVVPGACGPINVVGEKGWEWCSKDT
ncbi:MAG TPA: carboxymuconolactone decarboxylase family protein [Rubrobacter sp.]